MNDTSSLAHTKWNCKYHIISVPKYQRQEIYGKIKADTGTILRKLCGQKEKDAEIIQAQACPGHIRMPVSIPPKLSVARFAGYVKGKSALVISDRHADLRNKYGNRRFLMPRILCRHSRA